MFSYTRVNTAHAAAGINHQINFQGKLVNLNGTNVADGSYSVIFSIYNVASAGTNLWTETQPVTVTNGIFQVNLGSVTTLPASVDFNTDNIYLGIKVGTDAEMTPRVQFTSVPQAFNSEKLGGLDKTGFIQNGTSQQATSNFNISGTGVATSLQAGSFDTTGATTLSVGTGNANALTISRTGVLTTVAGSLTVTQATTLSSTLALTGAPTAIATSSLIQVGAAIAGGNAAVSGGTYYGLNAPATGAGSAADFLNFQLNGVSKLSVTNAGAVTATSFTGANSGDGSALTNLNGTNIATGTIANARLTNAGALTVTAGTGLSGGGAVALGGTTTLSLANTTVVPASYGSASSVGTFTVNAQGQLTTAASTAIVIAATQITSGNYVASVGAGTGTTVGGTAGTAGIPTINVTYGSLASTAAQGNTAIVCPSGTGNLTGGGTSIAVGAGGTCAALTVINNPSFSGLVTGSSATTGLALTGTPAASATSSLIQVGAAIAGGNAAVSGGTYYGLNAPATGAGSAADFLNFQLNGVSKLSVTNAGAVTATSFTGTHFGDGSALTNLNGTNIATGTVANARLVNSGALTITAGTGLSGGGSVFLGGSTTVNLANTTVVATSYGSASNVATFTVNGQGQLTTAASTAIAIAGSQITSGTVAVAQGGTGTGSFTQNGVLYGNTTGAIQATAAGTTGQCLVANTAAAPTFGTCGNGVTIVGTFDSQASAANGATISSGTIYLQSATASNPGLVNATTQTFGGDKTLSGALLVNNTGVVKTTSTTAFQVQNAGGTSIISVNTSLNRLGVNTTNPQYTLDVNGSAQISGIITPPSDFLTNYTYRKQLTVAPTTSATNYETNVILDTASLIAAGKMKSDCSDSRFTTANGTTLLNFYVEAGSCNASTTSYWVQMPSLSSGATYTIYFYYGYAAATSVSSAASTFHAVNPAPAPALGNSTSGNGVNTGCALAPYSATGTNVSGSIYCWGGGASGQMGDGTNSSANTTQHTVTGITNAVQIASGDSFNCAVLSTGSVKCWGLGTNGQLGNSASASSTTPVSVTGITTATAVSAGETFACALLSNSTVQCWGNGASGQLGNSASVTSNFPVTVTGIANATKIAVDNNLAACAVLSTGSIKCWGSSSTNGELGNGTTGTIANSPVPVNTITTATNISAAGDAICALLSGGSISCWGYGAYGQMGNGAGTAINASPTSVTGITTATSVVATTQSSGAQSPASFCAQLTGNTVKCWGAGNNGEMGNGTTGAFNFTPVSAATSITVTTLMPNGDGFCAWSAVAPSTTTLYCWGLNGLGQMNNGTSVGTISTPTVATNFTTKITSTTVRFDQTIDTNTTSVIRGNMAAEPAISGQSFEQNAGGGNRIFSVDTTSGQTFIKAYANSTNTLQVQNASGTNILAVDTTSNQVVANGILIKAYANSTNTLQVQNASGTNILAVDTTSNQVVANGSVNVNGNLALQSTNANGYVASITNLATTTAANAPGSSADGLLINIGTPNAARTTGNYFVGFAGAGIVAGKIGGNPGGVAYITVAADYAEHFKVFDTTRLPQPGELVSLDAAQSQSVKTATASSGKLVGVISTNPGFVGNGPLCKVDDKNCDTDYAKYNVLVALNGQVPTKVSVTNGAIHIGDPITASDVAGVGTKALTASSIVGFALEDTTVDGTIKIVLQPQFYDPTSGSNIQSGSQATLSALNVTGSIDASGLNVSGAASLGILTVKGSANVSGTLTVSGTTTVVDIIIDGHIITAGNAPTVTIMGAPGTNATVTIEGNDTSGTITITAGNSAVAATPTAPAVPGPVAGNMAGLSFHKTFGKRPRVIITPADAASAPLLVYPVDTSANGFIIGTTMSPSPRAVYTFTYFIVE